MSDPSKTDLRLEALAKRDALPPSARTEAAIALTVQRWPVELPNGVIVAGYSPIGSEIDPSPLMQALAERGAKIALPVVIARDTPLIFRAWQKDDALVRGSYGVFQPSSDAEEIEPDIVLVPLAAFDREGHRLGYGRGYYDRTLQALRAHKRLSAIGLAYATQEVPRVAAEPHDEKLDCVLTEFETIEMRRR